VDGIIKYDLDMMRINFFKEMSNVPHLQISSSQIHKYIAHKSHGMYICLCILLRMTFMYTYTCPNGRAGPARHGHGWTRHDFGVLRQGTPVSRAGPGWHVGPNPCPGTARQLLIGPGRGHGQPVGAVPGSGPVT
jgi:hypothetical protein